MMAVEAVNYMLTNDGDAPRAIPRWFEVVECLYDRANAGEM